MATHHIVERYRTARERLRQARGNDEADRHQDEVDALWAGMSEADRRTILGIDGREVLKRAAA